MKRTALSELEICAYLEFACRLAETAGGVILPHFRADLQLDNKAAGDAAAEPDRSAEGTIVAGVGRMYTHASGYDPVTVADRGAEAAIAAEIARFYPGHAIHGEEHGRKAGAESLTWVIDPIDGTRAFILGQLHWGTLIALNDGERPLLGVMHQPYVAETFVGSPAGAFLRRGGREERLQTRPCPGLRQARVCTSHPDYFARHEERAAFGLIASKAQMSRYGGDCYNYCLLAAGLIDLVIESELHAYDVQALIPMIEAAGGVMTGWDGKPCYEGGAVIASGDPTLHETVLELLRWTKAEPGDVSAGRTQNPA
jgi:histidinol phosphatase-like enzyme (inositol monophosphatase family)